MAKENALEASGESCAGFPTGFRRLTPSLLRADHAAESFTGLPDGVTMPGQLLAALKSAAPRLGLSPRLVHAIDWLFRFTQPQDWERGGRPIVWPSASMQQEALGLSPTQAKAINRQLIESGLITHERQPEWQTLRQTRPEGPHCRGLRLRSLARSPPATRNSCGWPTRHGPSGSQSAGCAGGRRSLGTAITQILETAAEYGFQGEEWTRLAPRYPGPRQGAQEGREARGDGPWRREPGAAAASGARTAGKPVGRAHGRMSPKQWIPTPWGRKTDRTNIPTNQVLILKGYGNCIRGT